MATLHAAKLIPSSILKPINVKAKGISEDMSSCTVGFEKSMNSCVRLSKIEIIPRELCHFPS